MNKFNTIISPVNIEDRKQADIRPGDTVRVWLKIKEGDRTRLQAFEGLVIARKHGKEPGASFTVRKVASGVGIEKIFPLYSPMIDKVEVVKRSKVKRARLYYIREKAAKEIKKKMRQIRFEAQEVIKKEETAPETDNNEEEVTEEKPEEKKEETVAETPKEEKQLKSVSDKTEVEDKKTEV